MSEQIARLIAVRDLTARVVYGQCECCGNGCDCGCSMFCPMKSHRDVNNEEAMGDETLD